MRLNLHLIMADARTVRPHTLEFSLEFSPESGGRTNRASLHRPKESKFDLLAGGIFALQCRDARLVRPQED